MKEADMIVGKLKLNPKGDQFGHGSGFNYLAPMRPNFNTVLSDSICFFL